MNKNSIICKFLPILFGLILISFLFISNNSFASNTDIDVPVVPEEYEKYVLTKDIASNGSISYILWVPKSSVYNDFFYLEFSGGSHIDYKTSELDTSYGGSFTYYNYNSSTKTFSRVGDIDYVLFSSTHSSWTIKRSVCKSTFNIYKTDGTLFFQGTPVEATIPALEAVTEIPMVMKKVLQMIIPIGLVVLLAVLVIYLVKSVISRMG